jgi:hypothetical protein
MTTVDFNRLKGNYAVAYVAAALSRGCLVRPVAEGTDIGIDLYCETVEGKDPFLHFWVQVKAGGRVRVSRDGGSASYAFDAEHLAYWGRQHVPVFAALVPIGWPPAPNSTIYIVNISEELLKSDPPKSGRKALKSCLAGQPGNHEWVTDLATKHVPRTTSWLDCRRLGVISEVPTLARAYERKFVPPPRMDLERIFWQLRSTAAFSTMFLLRDSPTITERQAIRRLASIASAFADGDPGCHWEVLLAPGLGLHADGRYAEAVAWYQKARQCIRRDRKVRDDPSWKKRVQSIGTLVDQATRGVPPDLPPEI